MKTTKEDFKSFKEYAKKWQTKLGLIEWGLYFEHADLKDKYGETSYSSTDLVARISLTKDWDDLRPKNDQELDKLALHEILHVLFGPLCAEARYRYTSDDAIDMAEHSIVRRLEQILLTQ